jgi:hypothetical protein
MTWSLEIHLNTDLFQAFTFKAPYGLSYVSNISLERSCLSLL